MLRTKGEAGTGNVVEAVRHARTVQKEIRMLGAMDEDELFVAAKEMQAPYDLVKEVARTGKLPVVNFAAGGVATPADAALMMQVRSWPFEEHVWEFLGTGFCCTPSGVCVCGSSRSVWLPSSLVV